MAYVSVHTLGCKVNQAESDELKAGLEQAGHSIVSDPAGADLCVVNTCTVTSESDRKSRKLVRMMGRRGASSIVVAGCYAEVSPGDLESLPGVIRVLPNGRKDIWLEEILSLLPEGGSAPECACPRHARSFIKVQDGCERGCSYCIVPRARGRERSRPISEVLEIAAGCARKGGGELVLCGINLGRYDRGPGEDLAFLVRETLSAGEGFRVRLSSIELEDLRMEWIKEWSATGRVCPHLHLPLQSGDEGVLRDMGRGYRPRDFLAAAETLRAEWPQAALTTEVIVGYPGESEESFRHTLEVLEAARPSRVHVFRFSPRPGTKAWGRTDTIPYREIEKRSAAVREMAEALRLGYIEERRGEIRAMLVEKRVDNDGDVIACGTTEDFIKGVVRGSRRGFKAGEIVAVRVCGVLDGGALLEEMETSGKK
jgi:threonylcarbamoyladenosine tRNA methylthiotransferase MtaB